MMGCLLPFLIEAGEYSMPSLGNDLVGENYVIEVKKGDSLTNIRQKHGVSYEELLAANPEIDFYKLKIGQKVMIPKQFILPVFREGVVINVPELRMYYFTGGKVYTFPVGLGREKWRTPLFVTKVVNKKADPSWHVPSSIRDYVYQTTGEKLPDVVAPGPSNPLGKYAIYLEVGSYLIHGTNRPSTVGAFISSGCVRMLRAPLQFIFNKIKIGTPVRIIYYPVKAGWLNNDFYLEVHKEISYYEKAQENELNNSDTKEILEQAMGNTPVNVDYEALQKVIKEQLGMPTVIGHR